MLPSSPAVLTYREGPLYTIKFNKPEKLNGLNSQMYKEWLLALKEAAAIDEVSVVVITGSGKYYSSGNQIEFPKNISSIEELEIQCRKEVQVAKEIVSLLISYPKFVIGAANGHALGFAVTTLALCDVAYAVETATFGTPFMKWAYCPEGCSSILFPRILGPSKANEMMLLGRKFTAGEMEKMGFLSATFPEEDFNLRVMSIAREAAKLPTQALQQSKKLIRESFISELEEANEKEMNLLVERIISPESMMIVSQYLNEKAKKRKLAKL